MSRAIVLVFSLLIALTLTGCMEQQQEIFLNSDGSGKLISYTKISPTIFGQMSMYGETADCNDSLKEMVQQEFDNSEVSAWEDVSFGTTEDGGGYIKTTRYFKSLDGLSGSGSQGPIDPTMLNWELNKTDDGKLVLKRIDYGADFEEMADKEQKQLTEQQIGLRVKQIKAQYEQSKIMMQQYMKGFKIKLTIHLPGTVEDVNAFEIIDDNTIAMEINAEKILKEYDEFYADEAKLRESIKKQDMPGGMGMDGMETIFGDIRNMRAVINVDAEKNVDYSEDIKSAKAGFAEMLKNIGMEYIEPIEVKIDPNDEPKIKSIEIIGANYIRKSPKKENDPSFKDYYGQQPRYSITVMADLSCPVSGISNIELISISDNKGKNLIKTDGGYAYSKYFSADKTRVCFDVEMELPSAGANTIDEFEGIMECLAMSQLETKDFGIIELKPGAITDGNDVWITEITPIGGNSLNQNDDSELTGIVRFSIKAGDYRIMNFRLFDENGRPIKADTPCGYQFPGRKTESVSMKFYETMPDVVNVKIEMTRHYSEFELPFGLGKFDLMGNILATD